MAFSIPNLSEVPLVSNQSEPDARDFDAIAAGFGGSVVSSGLAVTAQTVPNMTVQVAAGIASSTGTVFAPGAVASLAIGANATGNPRFDLVVMNSAGTIAVRAGTAAANPIFPTLTAGDVMLAAVWVPNGAASIANANIVDKRILRGQGRLWVSDYGPSGIGGATNMHLGAGGTTPNVASITWGDSTGRFLNFGTISAGAFAVRFQFDDRGKLLLPTTGSTGGLTIGGDASLYRSAAGELTVDGGAGGGKITLGAGTNTQLYIKDRSALFDWVLYVSAGAARLYNGADQFIMNGGQLQIPTTGSGGGIMIGTDAQWYRGAANVMQTDDEVRAPNLDALRYMAVGP